MASSQQMDEIFETALAWHAATARNDCDWQQLTEWLEASPLHREAYDAAALLDDQIARHRPALAGVAAASSVRRPMAWRRAGWGAAIAAGFVLVALGLTLLPGTKPNQAVERSYVAEAGRSLAVSLGSGVEVVLAPASRIDVGGAQGQQIRLTGSAYFEVPHDPHRELIIRTGAYTVRDIGTRFEIAGEGALLKVAVAEGSLAVDLPGRGQPVALAAGQQLLVAGDSLIAETSRIAADDVAGWRSGRLVFRDEPLSLVASQLGRHAGLSVTVDASIAQRRFSGVLAIGDGSQLVSQLGQIMGLQEHRQGNAVQLSAAPGDPARR